MAYEKLNLKNGDTLTEAHLQHLEEGIANAGKGSDLLDENGILKQEYFPEGFPYRRIADPVIMPGTTLTADPDSGTYTIPNTINTLALSADTRCVVKFEVLGYVLKFEVTPQKAPENDQGFKWVLGNTGLMGDGEDTGEPFLMLLLAPEVAAEAGIGGMMAFAYDAESVMLSIDLVDESFSTIDPSYLPSNCETVIVKVNGTLGTSGVTTTHTQAQIIELLNAGKNVILTITSGATSICRPVYYSDSLVQFSEFRVEKSTGNLYVRTICTSADISGWTEVSGSFAPVA